MDKVSRRSFARLLLFGFAIAAFFLTAFRSKFEREVIVRDANPSPPAKDDELSW